MEPEALEEDRFMINLLDLTDLVHELSSMCWDSGYKDINPALILLARGYLSTYDKIELIEIYIKHSHKHWEEIRLRNENFFIEHAHEIFKHLPVNSENINAFKILFTSVDDKGEDLIIKEDREAIWDYFYSLVKICIKYIHRIRGVRLVQTEKGMRPAYKNHRFKEIKVREMAKKWDIDLPILTT